MGATHPTHRLPAARGPLTDALLGALRRPPHRLPELGGHLGDPLGDDAQLALFVLQELGYRSFAGVDDTWEQEPSALTLRIRLEGRLEELLREAVGTPAMPPGDVPDAVADLVAKAEGPSLSAWMRAHGTLDHLREFAVHRSAYQLKEADPHSTAIPRLPAGPAKAALLAIQVDEYGRTPAESHAALFAVTMAALGLDPSAPDLDRLPAPTLATNTVLGTFASGRRLVGALLGHLAVFEMTSVEPMGRYAAAVRRLVGGGAGEAAARFYDVHVDADAHHQVLALDAMLRPFVADEPGRAADVLFGAAAVLLAERRFAEHLLGRWLAGRSSLRTPLPGSTLAASDGDLPLAG